MPPKKTVIVLLAQAKPALRQRGQSLLELLGKQAEVTQVVDSLTGGPVEARSAQLAVVFGGDGTFLAAARRLAGSDIPVVGVNLGRLGFLTEFSEAQFRQKLPAILAGELSTLSRMMLHARVLRDGQETFASPLMNDISILAGPPFRMIELSLEHNGASVCAFLGDGVVLSTPTGSTGYTLSAGGPILEPDMAAVIMTPVAAHSLSIRPIVMNADHAIRVVPLRANPGTSVTVDGQLCHPLQAGDRVEVARSPHSLTVVRNPEWPFFRKLSAKLQWGRSPHHND